MRKLLHAIYGMLKNDSDFDGEKFYALDRRQDWRIRTSGPDGAGKERDWENLRPWRWFSQSGEACRE